MTSLIIAADRDITLRPDFDVVIQEDLTTWATFKGADRMLDVIGDISASGLLYASSSQGNYSNIVVQDTASGRFYTTASSAIGGDTFKSTGVRVGDSEITGSLNLLGSLDVIGGVGVQGSVNAALHLINSGNTFLGSQASSKHFFRGNITASAGAVAGNISASGLLYASASSANGNPYQTVMMNTASGEFFYTW